MEIKNYKVIGVMSGTSLDGVDLAYCEFSKSDSWSFRLLAGKTIAYDLSWKKKLQDAMLLKPLELEKLDYDFGIYLAELLNEFINENKIKADLISSHGHTIFHQPQKGITVQIGSGKKISELTKSTVVCDFRKGDVALGGQGAPLVPIGDRLLFGEMDYCLNLGGIANISFEKNGERLAFDVCGCNIVLNYLANELKKLFDEGGAIARGGKLNKALLNELNSIGYYEKSFPKSLGREDIDRDVLSLINKYELPIADKLNTFCTHIAIQIGKVVGNEVSNSKMLITGGGAFNEFLIEQIEAKCNLKIVLPSRQIIDYKEAIIFAFLGVLRIRNENNCLKSVTGAERDSCGGDVFEPFNKS